MKELFILPPELNRRLLSTLMSSRSANSDESKSFSLKSTNEFAVRSGSIFGELHTLEKSHQTWMSTNEIHDSFEEPETKDIDQNDSEIFKKPLLPSKPCKRSPVSSSKFGKLPKKWTKYSLEDIPLSSDATNAAVALQFIEELRKRKNKDDVLDNSGKILFKIPKRKKYDTIETTVTATDENLPTTTTEICPIPRTLRKTIHETKKGNVCGTQIKLSHLEDENCD